MSHKKAKQERLFRTIKDGWMRCTDWNEFKSIEDEIKSLNEFLYKKYIHKEHSVLKQSPSDRWHEEYDQVQFLEEEKIEESFLHRTSKKVRLDQVISFNKEYYEVPYKYVGQVIEIRYDPLNLKELYIYEKERKIMSIEKVDKVANSKIKRKEGIDYARIVNDERLVEEKE